MVGTFRPGLALLSLLIASLACYQALDFSARIAAARKRAHRAAWIVVGTWVLAVGMWSLQFVGMLARMPRPIAGVDPLFSVASVLSAVLAGFLVLRMGDLPRLTRGRWLGGALGLGATVAALHMFTTWSLITPGGPQYRPFAYLAWFGLGTASAGCGLPILHLFQTRRPQPALLLRLWAAAGFGLFTSVLLHLAISLVPGIHRGAGVAGDASSLVWLGGAVGIAALCLMGAALGVAELVSQLDARTQNLSGSVDHLNHQLHHLANHDPLTGLPNRPMLVERLGKALADARNGGGFVAVLYLDLDGFKTINDTLGHSFGDELLRAVAVRLAGELRLNSIARMGGDEFVVVLDRMRDPHAPQRIAERLIGVMREPFTVRDTVLGVTPSIGIAHFPQDGQSVDDLIAHADAAMSDAKERGRNGYRCYDAAMQERAMRVLQIQRGLQVAIEDGSLSLHFQPKHDGRSGAMLGAEALIRWRHPELGQVPPMEFIGVAEGSGQIARIGEWVIQETCRQLCEWRGKGLSMVPIAINLSPVQINQPGLVDVAAGIVAAAGLPPGCIMFEVTESMAMQDAERTTAILREFRARGFEFAIDDFGTGYSSLAYLQKFQVRQLKIDQLFIRALGEGGAEPRAIIAAIIELAHTLGMEVVAEGVETAEQADALRGLGCDQVQGYYLARPMSAGDFEDRCLRGQARVEVA